MTDEQTEQVAKAIYKAEAEQDAYPECHPNWEDIPDYHHEWFTKARAAISAMPAPDEQTKRMEIDHAVQDVMNTALQCVPQDMPGGRSLLSGIAYLRDLISAMPSPDAQIAEALR